MARTIECFYPGVNFPAVSTTGKACSLNCKHCGRKYLEGMIPATTPEALLALAGALAERGANGFLISGGADGEGRVRLAEFSDAIREIKATTDLKINAHVGLSSPEEISELVESGIDSFSVDIYGSDDTIREVLGLGVRVQDYVKVIEDLRRSGTKLVVPHICVGIHGGKLRGELEAIDLLRSFSPSRLVFISLIPTKGTPYARVQPPSSEDMLRVVKHARKALPETKLLLGCMRSKIDRSNDAALVAAGLDGIVMPTSSTVERLAAEGFRIKKRSVCCSLP